MALNTKATATDRDPKENICTPIRRPHTTSSIHHPSTKGQCSEVSHTRPEKDSPLHLNEKLNPHRREASHQETDVNIQDAETFISVLFDANSTVTFQTFNEDKNEKRSLTKVIHGQLKKVHQQLLTLNNDGAGVFAMVNNGDGKGRTARNVLSINALFVDLDGAPLEPVTTFLQPHLIVETSPNRYHAYWLVEDCDLGDFSPVQKALAAYCHGDPKVNDLPRVMRVPGFYHRKGDPFLVRLREAHPELQRYKIAVFQSALQKELQVAQSPQAAPTFYSPEVIPLGERNDTLFRLACSMNSKNCCQSAVIAALREENLSKCYPPLAEVEVIQIAHSAHKYRHPIQLNQWDLKKERFTDQSNADLLLKIHGDKIRYLESQKKWLVYDGTRWLNNSPGEVHPYIKDMTEKLYQDAITLDEDYRVRIIRKILELEDVHNQKDIIAMASTDKRVIIQPSQLDNDNYLINVNNGTVDLRTGNLRQHHPEDFITKLVPVEYDPLAACTTWESFLHRVMGGNESLIRYLQRAVGYSLTGDSGEQCLFFLYGGGANGKSTYQNTLRTLFHDYAAQSPPELLMVKDRGHSGPCPELARLAGVRLVATSEIEDGQRLAEAAVKQLTGQDTVAARFLYGELFEFQPQFKIWLAANHKPVVRGTDNAIWRRIHLIPFTVTIPVGEQDHHLDAKLRLELPGILNWAIQGCMEWQEHGLQPPEEVKAAVQAYRREMDTITEWMENCCLEDQRGREPASVLYISYRNWTEDNSGGEVLTQTKFGRVMAEKGFQKVHSQVGNVYIGIRLKSYCKS